MGGALWLCRGGEEGPGSTVGATRRPGICEDAHHGDEEEVP